VQAEIDSRQARVRAVRQGEERELVAVLDREDKQRGLQLVYDKLKEVDSELDREEGKRRKK